MGVVWIPPKTKPTPKPKPEPYEVKQDDWIVYKP